MIQVFVCCEGPTDIGALKAFSEKCISAKVECMTHNDVKHIKVRRLKSGKQGKEKDDALSRKAYIRRIAFIANEYSSTFIAYHQDADRNYECVYEDVNSDLDEYREKGFGCVAIVPKEMTESWLLADAKAYATAFGHNPERPALPKKPEEIWGKREIPNSNYPKNVMERILKQYSLSPNREIFAEIADKSDIATVKARCPKSFARFVDDLHSLNL